LVLNHHRGPVVVVVVCCSFTLSHQSSIATKQNEDEEVWLLLCSFAIVLIGLLLLKSVNANFSSFSDPKIEERGKWRGKEEKSTEEKGDKHENYISALERNAVPSLGTL
jgi:hypothetical protein